tara:strand:+ start:3235 stop:3570 length:336 start_codon:yes stop_codon:yes gene_type:complete
MQKIKIISTIIIFGMLLGVTSTIKTQTRIIEKKITKLESNLITIKKNLHETQLDFFYLSSPSQLEKKINELSLTEYLPMDYSRIYLNFDNFLNFQKKITKNKLKNEEKAKE